MNEGHRQSTSKEGERLCKRQGIYGGRLNRRRRGSRQELEGWINYYQKQIDLGTFCPKRGAKIIKHFQAQLDKLGA